MKYVLCIFDEKTDYRVTNFVFANLEDAQFALKNWQILHSGIISQRILNVTDSYCAIQEDSNYILIAQIVIVDNDNPYAVGGFYKDDEHFFIDDFCDSESTALDTMEDLATNHFTKKSMKEYNTQKLSQPKVIKGYGRNETFDAYFVIDLNTLAHYL